MSSLFEACKAIPAVDVARKAGLILQQKGSRTWACCPLHGEKTPSLMFDNAGRWHCFGCGQGGDAVGFYAALYNVSQKEAAEALSGQFTGIERGLYHVPVSPAPALRLKKKVSDWYRKEWNRACNVKHKAAMLMADAEAKYIASKEQGTDYQIPPQFWQWLAAWSYAECRLELLHLADVKEIIRMMLEEQNELSKQNSRF
jgi:hypothetical protein